MIKGIFFLLRKIEAVRIILMSVIVIIYLGIAVEIEISRTPFVWLFAIILLVYLIYSLFWLWRISERLAYQYFKKIYLIITAYLMLIILVIFAIMVIHYKQLHLSDSIKNYFTQSNVNFTITIITTVVGVLFFDKSKFVKDPLIFTIFSSNPMFFKGKCVVKFDESFKVRVSNLSKLKKQIRFYGLANPQNYDEIMDQENDWADSIVVLVDKNIEVTIKSNESDLIMEINLKILLKELKLNDELFAQSFDRYKDVLLVFLDEKNNVYTLNVEIQMGN